MASGPADPKKEKEREEMAKLDAEIERAKRYRQILEEQNRALESVYTWVAPERLYRPKNREWYVGMAGIAIVIIVFSALTNNFGLIFAVIAVTLFIYAMNTIPPRIVTHEITNKGIKIQGILYLWPIITSFWVVKREDTMMLHFETIDKPGDTITRRMILLQGEGDIDFIVGYLVQHIDYLSSREAPRGVLGKVLMGEYQPLLVFLEGKDDITTKDPKDSPKALRNADTEKEKQEKSATSKRKSA